MRRIVVKGTLALVGILVAGCGQEIPYLLRSTAATAVLVSGGYRALNSADVAKQEAIRARAKAGDPVGAEAELDEYVPKRDHALKALDTASVGVETAYALVPVGDRVLDKKQRADLVGWAATLMKLGADVVAALTEVGVKVPMLTNGGSP